MSNRGFRSVSLPDRIFEKLEAKATAMSEEIGVKVTVAKLIEMQDKTIDTLNGLK